MRMSSILPLLSLLVVISTLGVLTGCGGKKVTRTETNTTVDLSGRWNDTDSRQTAETMIPDALSFPWVTQFAAANGRKPAVRLDRVMVRADGEAIASDIFLNDIRRAFIRSGQVAVVSNRGEADITRAELKDQDVHASEDTRSEAFQETGADFLLHGAINVQNDEEGRQQVRFYSIDLFLTNTQTREQVWSGNHKIKKIVETSRFR